MRKFESPRFSYTTSALLAAALCFGFTTTSAAERRGPSNDYDQVVAESRFGNGTVIGTVRQTRLGPQVRTPGGNWLYCKRSCSETLRVNTVDFWQNEGAGGGATDQEDGLLSPWLRWERRY